MEAAEDVFWSFFFDVLCVDGSQRAMFSMKDSHGHTCLHIAAAQEREALVRRLLEWGADPDALNNDGSKPRLLAAWTQGITSRVGDAARGADSKHLRHRATHFDDLPETHNQAPHSIRFKDQPDLLNPDASQAPEAAEKELQPPEEDELPQETSKRRATKPILALSPKNEISFGEKLSQLSPARGMERQHPPATCEKRKRSRGNVAPFRLLFKRVEAQLSNNCRL
eukprot:GHVT01029261.1.p1 GENE.GHVT01029261.1~~GHVT01029261.1.p1  ORF type:complete len:225 (-),score=57.38 GHVT01029261.1:39-713(-)